MNTKRDMETAKKIKILYALVVVCSLITFFAVVMTIVNVFDIYKLFTELILSLVFYSLIMFVSIVLICIFTKKIIKLEKER